jgi:hypothetical protein
MIYLRTAMSPINKNFYNAFIDLFSKIFEHLGKLRDIPQTEVPMKTVNDSGQEVIAGVQVPDIMEIIEENYDFIATLHELKKFKSSLTDDMTDMNNNRVVDFGDGFLIHNLIGQIVNELYALFDNSFDFNIEAAKIQYDRIEECFFNNEPTYFQKCLLLNFSADLDLIELGADIRIVKASEPEWGILYNARDFIGLDLGEYFQDIYFIETEIVYKKGEPHYFGQSAAISEDVLISLLLFKPGPVSVGAILEKPKYAFNFPGGVMFSSGRRALRQPVVTKYHLNESEVESFQKFCPSILSKIDKRFLRRASERFKFSHFDFLPEEKLIDLIIAMECMYLPNIRTESSFRLGLRAAKLLSESSEADAESIFNDLKMATDLRNCLVHGEDPIKEIRKIEKDYESLRSFVLSLEDYTRNSLRIFFENPEKRDDKFFKKLELSVSP